MRPPSELPLLPTDGSVQARYRVLLVLEATFAGAGRHVLDLAEGLLALGQEVHLAYSPRRMEPRFEDELHALEANGLVTVQVPMGPEPAAEDLAVVWRVRRYLTAAGPFDVVHGHSSKGGAVARLAATGLGAQRVYTPQAFKTMDPNLPRGRAMFYGAVERLLARFATDRLILCSPEEAMHARSQGMPIEKLTVVHNSVRIPNDLPDRVQARTRFRVAEDAMVVAWIGRLVPQKAPERFVAMVAGLRPELPNLRALMLGSGQLDAQVRDLIRARDLATILQLHGNSRGWDALAAADLLVLTSRYEAMPHVVLEAQALGIPVVATDVGGLREVPAASSIRIAPNTDDATGLIALVRAAFGENGASRQLARSAAASSGVAVMVRKILDSYAPGGPTSALATNAGKCGERNNPAAPRQQ